MAQEEDLDFEDWFNGMLKDLIAFRALWHQGHAKDPQTFPRSIKADNAGVLFEQFIEFEPEKELSGEKLQKAGRLSEVLRERIDQVEQAAQQEHEATSWYRAEPEKDHPSDAPEYRYADDPVLQRDPPEREFMTHDGGPPLEFMADDPDDDDDEPGPRP